MKKAHGMVEAPLSVPPQGGVIRSIRWRLITGALLTVSLPLVVFALVIGSVLWRFYLQQMKSELEAQARVIADLAAPALADRSQDATVGALSPAALAARWRHHASSRVTIADARSVIRATSSGEGVGATVRDARHPGLRDAIRGRSNVTVWKSPNFDFEETMYINEPVRHEGRLVGAVRVAHSLTHLQRNVDRVRTTLVAMVIAYALLLAALTLGLAGSIVRPIERLQRDALRIAGGDLAHRVRVTGHDEIAQLATTLNQMTARLEVLEGLRRQYVSDVSHELRTPLTAIRSMTETMLQYGDSDPALRDKYLPRILTQTDRLARLATQFLDLAQIESGNLIGGLAPVALSDVLDEVAQTQASRAASLGIALSAEVAPALPPVNGDRDRLTQVFVNLVDNALRYTPPGGHVTLRAKAAGDHVEVTVEDSGQGVPPEHLPHLFDRFHRVEKARSPRSGGGAGLGLAIVRQIVETHGGTIHVASTLGVGTTFRIELPAAGPGARISLAPTRHELRSHQAG